MSAPEPTAGERHTCGFGPEDEASCPACRARAATPDADDASTEGCDCKVLCSMGPTCPGGMAANLPGSGCWRTDASTEASEGRPLPARFRPCPSCGRSVLTTYRTEADPTGKPAEHDCATLPPEGHVEALAEALANHRSSRIAFIREANGKDWRQGVNICTCGETFTGSHDTHLATVLAAREAKARSDERERIAQAIEAEASRSSYRDPYAATEAYLDAARIVRGDA